MVQSADAIKKVDQLSNEQNVYMYDTVAFNNEILNSVQEKTNQFHGIVSLVQENKSEIEQIVANTRKLNEIINEMDGLLV